MCRLDGTSKVVFVVKTNCSDSKIEETFTLKELGLEGLEGDMLEEFLDLAYESWVWKNIDGSVEFVDEYE